MVEKIYLIQSSFEGINSRGLTAITAQVCEEAFGQISASDFTLSADVSWRLQMVRKIVEHSAATLKDIGGYPTCSDVSTRFTHVAYSGQINLELEPRFQEEVEGLQGWGGAEPSIVTYH